MKSKFKGALGALMLVAALSSIAAASASAALPEFVGQYPTTTEARVGTTYLESSDQKDVECKTGIMSGSITSASKWTGTIKYTSCTFGGPNGKKCSTTGAAKGEIVTESLTGNLVYISRTSKTVGLTLNGPSETMMNLDAECLIGPATVTGGLLVPLTPVNASTREHLVTFKESRGIQNPDQYEHETKGVKGGEGSWLKATDQLIGWDNADLGIGSRGLSECCEVPIVFFSNKAFEIKA